MASHSNAFMSVFMQLLLLLRQQTEQGSVAPRQPVSGFDGSQHRTARAVVTTAEGQPKEEGNRTVSRIRYFFLSKHIQTTGSCSRPTVYTVSRVPSYFNFEGRK
jgi:hypothetical protein